MLQTSSTFFKTVIRNISTCEVTSLGLIISWAVLVSALVSLGVMETAALQEVTLPLVVFEGPVLTLGGWETSLA